MSERRQPSPRGRSRANYETRARARQRHYREEVLRVGAGAHPHWLDREAMARGANFTSAIAHRAAREREARGKGVGERTFKIMTASQPMCFNIFAPLAADHGLAAQVLKRFFPGLLAVESIAIEHTPDADIFADQSGLGGVDCDLLVEAITEAGPQVIVIETKLVESGFSLCSFRDPARLADDRPYCPDDVGLAGDGAACLYVSRKGYRYWQRSWETASLRRAALESTGCPFGGQLWQLWCNHTLAHVEARRRGAKGAHFAVCAPAANEKLDGPGAVERFRALVSDPGSVSFIEVEALIGHIGDFAGGEAWHEGLVARYCGI